MRIGLSWTEAGELDLATALHVLEVATGKKAQKPKTFVSRRKKKPASIKKKT